MLTYDSMLCQCRLSMTDLVRRDLQQLTPESRPQYCAIDDKLTTMRGVNPEEALAPIRSMPLGRPPIKHEYQ